MKQVNVRLEPELIKTVKKIGLDEDISFQAFVTEAIERYVAIKLNPQTETAPQPSSIESYKPSKLSVETANEDIKFMLQLAANALTEEDTQKVIIYNNPLDIEIDQSPPLPEVSFAPKIFEDDVVPEYYQNTLTRDDVDPLENMPEEEWKAALEELKRERGL